jgi:orotidine-5'-phosphate decarboxylase
MRNEVARRLVDIIESKRTNLIVAADVTTKQELLALAKNVGPSICCLKTHIDIVDDFDLDLIYQLQALAQKHNFLIIEDKKFADIGSTEQAQYRDGVHKVVEWADIVTVHALCGLESLSALEHVAQKHNNGPRGAMLVVQLSCKGNLIDDNYTQKALEIARRSNFVIGLVAQEAFDIPSLITFTPGVNIVDKGDNLGQQYNSPEHVIGNRGTDVIIVGRAIYNAKDQRQEAERYRQIAWDAYGKRSAVRGKVMSLNYMG